VCDIGCCEGQVQKGDRFWLCNAHTRLHHATNASPGP
jgi:hypothetical protein